MKLLISLFCTAMFSFSLFAETEVTTEVTDPQVIVDLPDVYTVISIYEYCVEQYSEQQDSTLEKSLLACVNSDLESSAYQTFSSYTQLKSALNSTEY